MQRFRQILHPKRRVFWLVGLLLIFLLISFTVPLKLTAHEAAKRNTTLKFYRTIPLQGWFSVAEPVPQYPEIEDDDPVMVFEPNAIVITVRYQKDLIMRYRLDGQEAQITASVALWETDRIFLVFSLEVKPDERAIE